MDAVGDNQMRMEQGVAFSGRPVIKSNGQQPLSGHVLDTTVATSSSKVLVQVGDRLGHAGVMGLQHRPAGRRIAQPVEDGHALGRPQHHVERGDGVAAVGPAEELAGGGMAALEHAPEARRRCFALQP
jgi:hypothetical protein